MYIYIYIYINIYMHMHIYVYMSPYLSHMHILYRAWSKCVRGCSQHLSNVHICTSMVLNNTCECMPTLRKNAYWLVHVHLYNSTAASLSSKLLRTYLESCANIVQAVVYRIKKIIPMYITVTYIEYVKVLEAIKTHKRIPWKETFPESVFQRT